MGRERSRASDRKAAVRRGPAGLRPESGPPQRRHGVELGRCLTARHDVLGGLSLRGAAASAGSSATGKAACTLVGRPRLRRMASCFCAAGSGGCAAGGGGEIGHRQGGHGAEAILMNGANHALNGQNQTQGFLTNDSHVAPALLQSSSSPHLAQQRSTNFGFPLASDAPVLSSSLDMLIQVRDKDACQRREG